MSPLAVLPDSAANSDMFNIFQKSCLIELTGASWAVSLTFFAKGTERGMEEHLVSSEEIPSSQLWRPSQRVKDGLAAWHCLGSWHLSP